MESIKRLAAMCIDCYSIKLNAAEVQTHVNASNERNVEVIGDLGIDMRCPVCKGSEEYFRCIDNDIAKAVSILNKIGYTTEYSCQGHANYSMDNYIEGDYKMPVLSYPYITIKSNKKISKKLLKCFVDNDFNMISYPQESFIEQNHIITDEDFNNISKHKWIAIYLNKDGFKEFLGRRLKYLQDHLYPLCEIAPTIGFAVDVYFSTKSILLGEALEELYTDQIKYPITIS